MIYIIIGVVAVGIAFFFWCICKAAGDADRAIEESFREHDQ